MTKKELLEAIKDMPEDARIIVSVHSYGEWTDSNADTIYFNKQDNTIEIC